MGDVPQSVWLVGLSGAGKTTLGPLLAARLGFAFVDLDAEAVDGLDETIEDVFRTGGEPRFRALEAEATARMAGRARVVVATGGGWMARSDVAREAPGRLRVWLRVSPETAIHRLSTNETESRPLLDEDDPTGTLERLHEQRRVFYEDAEVVVDTDGLMPPEIVESVMTALADYGMSGQ